MLKAAYTCSFRPHTLVSNAFDAAQAGANLHLIVCWVNGLIPGLEGIHLIAGPITLILLLSLLALLVQKHKH